MRGWARWGGPSSGFLGSAVVRMLSIGRILVLATAMGAVITGAWAGLPMGEDFATDPVAAGRFVQGTAGTESVLTYDAAGHRLVALLDVDSSPAYYLSNLLPPVGDGDTFSFSAEVRVESVDDRASPMVFIGLMTTTHVGKFGDGLSVNLSTSHGRLVATARVDDSGAAQEKFEGAEVEIQLGTDYLVAGTYSAATREFMVTVFGGPAFMHFVGRSMAVYPEGRHLSVDRLGLQNNGAQTTDSAAGSLTVSVGRLDIPGRFPVVLTAADVMVGEGDSGTTNAVFQLEISAPSSQVVTVGYETADYTAVAGLDYVAVSGTATFLPGMTNVWVSVPVLGDRNVETNETFELHLSRPDNASLVAFNAIATIVDDDVAILSVVDAVVREGDAGMASADFVVTLGAVSSLPVSAHYETVPGTASANVDFLSASGTVTFPAGTTRQVISVPVLGDTMNEGDETFTVVLSSPENGVLGNGIGIGTIVNDDAQPTFSVDDISVTEGDLGPVNGVFTVRLSNPTSEPVRVSYSTTDGTAGAGSDYLRRYGTVTFQPGVTSQVVPVTVLGDTRYESDEDFFLSLTSNTLLALPTRDRARCVIVNDDSPPSLTIGDVSVAEGNAGETNATFVVHLWPPSDQIVSVDYRTVSGTAVAGPDFLAATGTLTFLAGVTNQCIRVRVLGDTVNEPNKTFLVELAAATNAAVARGQAVGTIVNDDGVSVSIEGVTVTEGNSGTVDAIFKVNLSGPATSRVTVDYGTVGGTATPGADFLPRAGTLVFDPGVVSMPIVVPVVGDILDEPVEAFTVVLGRAVGATLATAQGTCIILDDDLPAISVIGQMVVEPTEGTSPLLFFVSLTLPSDRVVTVDYETADLSAKAGTHYLPASGTLTIAPGGTAGTVAVLIRADHLDDANRTFLLRLTNPVGATLAIGEAVGGIADVDAAPVLSIQEQLSVWEGDNGASNATAQVVLSTPSAKVVSVDYSTSDGSAVAGQDYLPVRGTVRFPPGETRAFITVPVIGDTVGQGDRFFRVDLGTAVNAPVVVGHCLVMIFDDDLPTLSVRDVAVLEGDSGATNAAVVVSLSKPSDSLVTVEYATLDETAKAGVDYRSVVGVVSFVPGMLHQTVLVPVLGDRDPEGNERFHLMLFNPVGAAPPTLDGLVTIIDDDIPKVTVNNPSVLEGAAGTLTPIVFTLSLGAPLTSTASLRFATADVTARAGLDYIATNGIVVFPAGTTNQSVIVWATGDDLPEGDEALLLQLFDPVNVALQFAAASATIRDDDVPPEISVDDVALLEGDSGPANAVFTIRLSRSSSQVVSVDFASSDDTATAGSDYLPRSVRVGFPPGSTNRTVTVPVLGDTSFEPNETFMVRLGAPTNGTLARSVGVGTIINDDRVPMVRVDDAVVQEGDSGFVQALFTATLDRSSLESVSVDYQTVAGTATAGIDFVPAQGRLIFAPGEVTRQISISVVGDTRIEDDEFFTLGIVSPVNATLWNSSAKATIRNDDGATIRIAGTAVKEGNSGSTMAEFPVTLDAPSDKQVSVDYSTEDGTATGGQDYTAVADTLVFAPGVTSMVVRVPVLGDILDEPSETFRVKLGNPRNAVIGVSAAVGTILDDDPPSITVHDASINAGNGTVVAEIPVSLSSPSLQAIQVDYATFNGTANAGTDYEGTAASFSFQPGATNGVLRITVKGNTLDEGSEYFVVALANPRYATIGRGRGNCTILNLLRANVPPVVDLLSPTNGASFTAPANISLTTSTSDPDGEVVQVEFFAGAVSLGVSTQRPFQLDWSPVTPGTYSLSALATDNRGATTISGASVVTVGSVAVDSACAVQVYQAAFDDLTAGTEWSARVTSSTPGSREGYLGPFGNETVSLNLGRLPTHSMAVIAFDLYLLNAWGESSTGGQDIWEMSVEGGPTLVRTRFSNQSGGRQSYPGPYPGGDFPAGTGAVAVNSLGYDSPGDSTYHFELPFMHPGTPIVLHFTARGLSLPSGTAAWGLDNVVVRIVSESDPSVTTSPSGQTVNAGADVLFQVQVESVTPLHYQWRYNGTGLTNATGSTLALHGVTSAQAGVYDVVVGNCAGSIISAPAQLVVNTTRTPPTVSRIPSATTLEDATSAQIGFTIGDRETPVGDLRVTVVSLNKTLIPDTGLHITGSGADRFLVVGPAPDQFGTGGIIVTVTDSDGLRASEVFDLVVKPVNDVPTLGPIADRAVDEDSGPLVIPLLGIGAGVANENQRLSASVRSDNPALVATATVSYFTPATSGALTLTFPADASGTVKVTVTVRDDGGTLDGGVDQVSRTFLVTVNPVNDPPSFLAGPDQVVEADSGARIVSGWARSIVAGPADEAGQVMVFGLTSDVPALFAVAPSVSSTGVLSFTPAPGKSGTAHMVVTLRDNGGTARGGLSAGSPQYFTITVRPHVNQSPTVNLSSPAAGSVFQAGQDIVLRAVAADADGAVSRVEFSQGGTRLGDAVAAPFEYVWRGAVQGNYMLTATATDENGAATVSVAVPIQVTAPGNQPPLVAITSPADLSGFGPYSTVVVDVSASDADGTVTRVELFAGSVSIAVMTAAPYRYSWADLSVGDYVLTARATDNRGAVAISDPVQLVVSEFNGEVAVVRNGDDAEIQALKQYLFGMGLTSHVFDQSGITLQELKEHSLVIWDDSGRRGLADATVEMLYGVYQSGVPLYLIGDNLGAARADLSPSNRERWDELLHAYSVGGKASGAGTVVVPVIGESHCLLEGKFGLVSSFAYTNAYDRMSANTDAESYGVGLGGDVLIGYPTLVSADVDWDVVRIFTQHARLITGGGPASELERKRVFQNAVTWLLKRCRLCTSLKLSVDLVAPEDPLQVGKPATFTFRVRQSGECEGVDVMVTHQLAPGVSFVSADSKRGRVDLAGGVVTFSIGHMSSAESSEMSLTVVPMVPGELLTGIGVYSLNDPFDPETHVSWVTNQVSGGALLSFGLAGDGQMTLALSGTVGKAYQIQTSSDLVHWTAITNVVGPAWSMPVPGSQGSSLGGKYFRSLER